MALKKNGTESNGNGTDSLRQNVTKPCEFDDWKKVFSITTLSFGKNNIAFGLYIYNDLEHPVL